METHHPTIYLAGCGLPDLLTTVLIAVLTPAGALLSAYLVSRVTSREQLGHTRRVETTEMILTLLYELNSDFVLWIDP